MKIEKVSIKNFRNYEGEHHFDLSKDITIFYGDNGFGKSSFFDALEWCISGTISRFSDEGESERLKKDLINRHVLASNNNEKECSICIEFNNNKLIRKFTVKDNVFGNVTVKITDSSNKTLRDETGKLINSRERVDQFLSGAFQQTNNPQKNLFGKLMKQTFILSQDQVTDFISSEDPVETFRSIASIMGFKPLLNHSDNIKKVHSGLNSNYKKYKEKIEEIERAVTSKQETKRNADIIELNTNLNILSIDISQETDIENEIKVLRNKKLSEILKYKEMIEISSSIEEKFIDLNEYKSEISNLNKNEISLNLKSQAYELLEAAARSRIEQLRNLENNLVSYNLKSKKIEEIKKELLDLNSPSQDVSILQREIEEKNKLNLKIQYAVINHNSYHQYKQTYNLFPEEIKKLNINLDNLDRLLKKRRNIIGLIDKKLVESENGVLVNLLNNVKEIHKYVKHSTHESEKCPVCSSVREDGLLKAIDQNILSYSEEINSVSTYAEKLLTLKTKLNENIHKISNLSKEIKEKIKGINRNKIAAEKGIETIEKNNLFDNKLMEKKIEFLNEEKSVNESQINQMSKTIELLFELKQLKQENEQMGGNFNFVSEKDVHKRIERLTRALSRITDYINKLKDKVENTDLVKQLENKLQQFETAASNLKLNTDLSFNDLKIQLTKDLSTAESDLNIISKVEKSYDVITHNQHIEDQISELNEEKINLNIKRNQLEKIIDSLSLYMSDVFGDFGSSAKDFLNNYNSPIQKYFRYLNPLPTRSTVRFEGTGESLSARVIFDENDEESDLTSPKNILSSGQLNVLAISIFLAMNDSQKIHELDFIAIDDPIQNMDDVNQFSICDVLGSIKKQLIFSTHDFEFLKLFIKKNEHKKETIQVYNFKSPFLLPDKIKHVTFN